MPVNFLGLFVRIRIVVRPRSARIWLPIPYSRASAGRPSSEVRLDRVQARLLQLVRLELVQQADAAALLRHVQEHARIFLGQPLERLLELLAAVAAQRVEDVAGQALGVDADEDVLGALDVASHERDVVLAGQLLAERDRLEVAVGGRELDGRRALDELLRAPPVLDQVGDRDQLDLVALAELERGRGHAPSFRPPS